MNMPYVTARKVAKRVVLTELVLGSALVLSLLTLAVLAFRMHLCLA